MNTPSRCFRCLCWLTSLAALALLPSRVRGQEVLPATLLRRVGSAVEGYRIGRPVWVVVSRQFPHNVAGVYMSNEEAQQALRLAGLTYVEMGPYAAATDSTNDGRSTSDGRSTMLYGLVCIKQLDTSCLSDSTHLTTMDSVRSVTISIQTTSGSVISRTLPPERVEAVYFTMSALDKQVITYYTQVYGIRYAASFREEVLRNLALRARR
ncbi:MAG TPA: hypothetical protein VKP10_05470 [Gemmatimonadales bacterium]|nr:hypothetical protein [Gemmatimonadales bacterium]